MKVVELKAEEDFMQGVIDLLELVLEEARAGHIDGIGITYTEPGDLARCQFAGLVGVTLLGETMLLQKRMFEHIDK